MYEAADLEKIYADCGYDIKDGFKEYVKENGNLDGIPFGLHSVVHENKSLGIEKGVIYVLKNINNEVNIDSMNQLHPFYLVYIKEDGEILSNHLNVKNTLDLLRIMSKGKNEPDKTAYNIFNEFTNDGRDMKVYSELLSQSIESIINIKEENDIDSLFRSGGTTMLKNDIKGLEDLELITFMVVI